MTFAAADGSHGQETDCASNSTRRARIAPSTACCTGYQGTGLPRCADNCASTPATVALPSFQAAGTFASKIAAATIGSGGGRSRLESVSTPAGIDSLNNDVGPDTSHKSPSATAFSTA